MISQTRLGLKPKLGRRYFFGLGKKFPNPELINPMALKQNKPKNGIQRLELTYSQRRNALNQTMVHTLQNYFEEVEKNKDVKVIIIESSLENDYLLGNDYREILNLRQEDAELQASFKYFNKLMEKMNQVPQIIIASVGKPVCSTGLHFISSCDLVVATDKATFQLPDLQAGVFPASTCLQLVGDVGRRKALEMYLTGESLTAQQAMRYGLINKVVGEHLLEKETQKFAEKVCEYSGSIIEFAKRNFYMHLTIEPAKAFPSTSQVMANNAMMADAEEGMDAITRERRPMWIEKSN